MTNDEIFTIAESLGCEIPSGPEGKEFYFSPTELLEFVKSITFASESWPRSFALSPRQQGHHQRYACRKPSRKPRVLRT